MNRSAEHRLGLLGATAYPLAGTVPGAPFFWFPRLWQDARRYYAEVSKATESVVAKTPLLGGENLGKGESKPNLPDGFLAAHANPLPRDVAATYEPCLWTAQQIHDFVPYLHRALVACNVASTKILLAEDESWQTNLHATAWATRWLQRTWASWFVPS